ncbi:MAG: DUF5615 family PIN-like protein [Bifidobacteriaceae bacterium]|nr:DUF5615 family PIN-like protein [Bifidobacteriaceae bacterium]
MRILVDQNLSPALAERLVAVGHDAVHTASLGLEKATDPEVFGVCLAQGRVLITADKKLTKFLAATRATGPSVIVVRGFGYGRDAAAAMSANLSLVERTIAERGPAVFSVWPGRPIRVELLPIGLADQP